MMKNSIKVMVVYSSGGELVDVGEVCLILNYINNMMQYETLGLL